MALRKKHIIVSAVIALGAILVIVILAQGLALDPTKVPSALLNQPAHDFSIPFVQGKEIIGGDQLKLSAALGHPTILNFWASWCTGCREEAHMLEAFWKEQGGRVLVLGVAVQDTNEAAMEFIKTFGKTYPIGLDTDGKVGIDFGVYGVPETFFIDPKGIIRHKETGPVTRDMLVKFLPLIQ